MGLPLEAKSRFKEEYFRIPSLNIGFYLPTEFISNNMVESWGATTKTGKPLTADYIKEATGIERRFVERKKSTAEMAVSAARFVVDEKEKIDFVIATTSFPDKMVSIGQTVNNELGLNARVEPDKSVACSGFVYILNQIADNRDRFEGKNCLVAASEKYSPYLAHVKNQAGIDPSLAQLLFSDGAAAVLLKLGENIDIHHYKNFFFPELSKYIRMPVDISEKSYQHENIPVAPSQSGYFEQDGGEVLKVIKRKIAPLIHEAIIEGGFKPEDIQLIIPHQPSIRALDYLEEKLPQYSVYRDIQNGNFSSASVPIALRNAILERKVGKGDNIVLAQFGAGMMLSTAIISLK